jgi:hypothetical protein
MKILQLQYFTRRRVPTLDNYLRQKYLKVKPQPTRSFIQVSQLRLSNLINSAMG